MQHIRDGKDENQTSENLGVLHNPEPAKNQTESHYFYLHRTEAQYNLHFEILAIAIVESITNFANHFVL